MTCGLCISISARSKVPLKRYNILTAALYPSSSDLSHEVSENGEVSKNTQKKISNLTEYASSNPHRIPKIARRLERRAVRELNAKCYGNVHIAIKGFESLTAKCSKHKSLYALHVFKMISTLLAHSSESMQVLAVQLLQSFLQNDDDATYMRQLDGYVPTLQSLTKTAAASKTRTIELLATLKEYVKWMSRTGFISEQLEAIIHTVLYCLNVYCTDTPVDDSSVALEEVSLAMAETPVETEISIATLTCDLLREIAFVARDAASARRVLEPVLQYYDSQKWWTTRPAMVEKSISLFATELQKTDKKYLLTTAIIRHLGNEQVGSSYVLAMVNIIKKLIEDVPPDVLDEANTSKRPSAVLAIQTLSRVFPPEDVQLQTAILECVRVIISQPQEARLAVDLVAGVLENESLEREREESSRERENRKATATIKCLEIVADIGVQDARQRGTLPFVGDAFPQMFLQGILPFLIVAEEAATLGAHRILLTFLKLGAEHPEAVNISDAHAKLLLGALYEHVKIRRSKLSSAVCLAWANMIQLLLKITSPESDILTKIVPLAFKLQKGAMDCKSRADGFPVMQLGAAMLASTGQTFNCPELCKLVASDSSSGNIPLLVLEDGRLEECNISGDSEHAMAATVPASVSAVTSALTHSPTIVTSYGGAKQLRTNLMLEYSQPAMPHNCRVAGSSMGRMARMSIMSTRETATTAEQIASPPIASRPRVDVLSAKAMMAAVSGSEGASMKNVEMTKTSLRVKAQQAPSFDEITSSDSDLASSTTSLSNLLDMLGGDLFTSMKPEQAQEQARPPLVPGVDSFMHSVTCH